MSCASTPLTVVAAIGFYLLCYELLPGDEPIAPSASPRLLASRGRRRPPPTPVPSGALQSITGYLEVKKNCDILSHPFQAGTGLQPFLRALHAGAAPAGTRRFGGNPSRPQCARILPNRRPILGAQKAVPALLRSTPLAMLLVVPSTPYSRTQPAWLADCVAHVRPGGPGVTGVSGSALASAKPRAFRRQPPAGWKTAGSP
ncbi:protein of unknown function [Candidatus Methylocalor cossyra]|uniref:Uncharacterized protein n=1 Tax=Candidatus Methylocalor cossyra TaxID=3108543 RepID=A0ABM9NHZ3_9GAMM